MRPRLVRNAFVKIAENGVIQDRDASYVVYTALFLDASSHLYKRVCPSVRPSVGPSVGPSVRRSVRPSVRPSVGPSVGP